ncbi:MAG: 50S ribosomal protein L25 [Phycisphaeraceae bacterium]
MATHEIPKVEAQVRERTGTRYARRLRAEGKLPANVYGRGKEPVAIIVDAKAFSELVEHNAHLLQVAVDGNAEPCLIKEVQWDHLGTQMVHADLTRVDMSEDVEVEIEVELTGEPTALNEPGAVLTRDNTMITISCRPDAIPDVLHHDITDLAVNETVTVGDLTLPAGVSAVSDADTVLGSIHILAEEPEEEPEVEAAEGEPEVIGGKEEEGAEEK